MNIDGDRLGASIEKEIMNELKSVVDFDENKIVKVIKKLKIKFNK